jgi:mannosyltransferase
LPLVPGSGKPTVHLAPDVGDGWLRRVPAWAPGAGVALAVVVGVVARFSAAYPLWLDEALTANIAALPVGDIPEALARDGHPPLHYWLLSGWMRVVGEGDLALRALSGLIGVASLPLAWLAGGRLAGPAGARWALVVTSLSPFAVRYATEARMYSLVMLLVLAGYLLLTDALRRPTWPRLSGVALVATALLWTHYWSAFLLAVVGALVLLRWWRAAGDRRAAAARVAGALIVGGLLFLPWVPTLLDQLADTGTPWASPSRPTDVVAVTLDDLGGGGWAEARLHGAVSLVLVVVALLGARAGRDQLVLGTRPTPVVRWELAVAGATLALGSVVAFAGRSAYASRYAAVLVPLLLLAVAVGFTVLPAVLRAVTAVAWVVTALVGLGQNALVERTAAGDVAAAIAEGLEPGDVVVACPDQLGVGLQRALDQRGVAVDVVPYPAGGDARFVDWRDYEERNRAADPLAFADEVEASAGTTVWVLWSSSYRTFEGDCEALVTRLGALRPATVVVERADRFETGELRVYRSG